MHLARIEAMTAVQAHRGPDDGGVEQISQRDPAVLFGHRRLSIIDLSPAGHQPMCDPDTGSWITFNGEIYNFEELRRRLTSLGQVFRTRTDTEVILKAYAAWGAEGVRQLRGIFAFGLWDAKARTLLLARDQLGVKPLYYWHDQSRFLFGSEVRALLASGLVPRRLNLSGLHSFLAYGSLQEPLTMVEGVQSLLPGHVMIWAQGRRATRRYWQLPAPDEVAADAPADVYDVVKQKLAEAVRLQLVADVPLGAFLSGGIDSTAVAALAQSAANHPIKTFSVVFDETAYDESEYSRQAAQHIGTDHAELRLTGHSVVDNFPSAIRSFDQPSVDGLNTYFVSKVTREAGLTVALSGVGGDELFAGYDGYGKTLLAERWGARAARLPRRIRWLLADALELAGEREDLRKAVELLRSPASSYFISRLILSPSQADSLLAPAARVPSHRWQPAQFANLAAETANYDRVNRAAALELQTYMLSTLLRDTDQMSMAHALEVRVPLIDHELVEYVFRLPGHLKLAKGEPKPLLTRALNGAIPPECIYRPKRGFVLPFAVWLRESMEKEVRSMLLDPQGPSRDLWQAEGLANIWRQFENGRLGWSRVWGLYILMRWLQEHQIAP
jgi:asparagine synthase (glutamine-hydrolysing)